MLEPGTRVTVTPTDGRDAFDAVIVRPVVPNDGAHRVAWYIVRDADGVEYDALPDVIT